MQLLCYLYFYKSFFNHALNYLFSEFVPYGPEYFCFA